MSDDDCCWWGLSFGGRPPIRPSLPRGVEARLGPFLEHRALELGERADHLHHHPTRGRGGVHRFLEAAKACVALLHPLHDGQYIAQGA